MSETDEPREPADEWFEYSAKDPRAAEVLLAQDPPLVESACFHAQQAVEKALKGYLASRSQPVQKTHDLVALVRDCAQIDPEFRTLAQLASGMADYAVEARYPDTPFSVTPHEASVAVHTADGIVRFVRLRVGRK